MGLSFGACVGIQPMSVLCHVLGAEAEIGAMATLRDQADERHAQLRVYKEMRDHKLANVIRH